MLNREKTITISLDEYSRLLESQKQVDELTEELDFYKCANRELTSTNEMVKGIVKNLPKNTA